MCSEDLNSFGIFGLVKAFLNPGFWNSLCTITVRRIFSIVALAFRWRLRIAPEVASTMVDNYVRFFVSTVVLYILIQYQVCDRHLLISRERRKLMNHPYFLRTCAVRVMLNKFRNSGGVKNSRTQLAPHPPAC